MSIRAKIIVQLFVRLFAKNVKWHTYNSALFIHSIRKILSAPQKLQSYKRTFSGQDTFFKCILENWGRQSKEKPQQEAILLGYES